MVEHLVSSAIALGLSSEQATRLAAQTCLGAGKMLVESSESRPSCARMSPARTARRMRLCRPSQPRASRRSWTRQLRRRPTGRRSWGIHWLIIRLIWRTGDTEERVRDTSSDRMKSPGNIVIWFISSIGELLVVGCVLGAWDMLVVVILSSGSGDVALNRATEDTAHL